MINNHGRLLFINLIIIISVLLTGCGFHLQQQMKLAKPLHKLYIKSDNPYGTFVRNTRQLLKASKVRLVEQAGKAKAILIIESVSNAQNLASVNISQQTRKYNLVSTVQFYVTDGTGNVLLPVQRLSKTSAITVQTNSVLGGSNQANIIFKQLQIKLARDTLYRLSSFEVTRIINNNSKQINKEAVNEN